MHKVLLCTKYLGIIYFEFIGDHISFIDTVYIYTYFTTCKHKDKVKQISIQYYT